MCSHLTPLPMSALIGEKDPVPEGKGPSLADALPVLRARAPDTAEAMLAHLDLLQADLDAPAPACLREVAAAAVELRREGFSKDPGWHALYDGARPPKPERDEETSPWERGWQHHACSARETYFQERVVLPALTPSARALLRSL